MKKGRPTLYTPEIAREICERVAACEAVHQFAGCNGMPCEDTIYEWLKVYPEFSESYTRARERQADREVAECREIADMALDKMGSVEQARLRVQVRQWAAERRAPKKYGARTRTELTGADGEPLAMLIAEARETLRHKLAD